MENEKFNSLNLFIWMVLSIVCFSIFNAYRYVEDKETDVLLLTVLFAFIGIYALLKLANELDEGMFQDKTLHYFWFLNGIFIPMSLFLIKNHPQLPQYLIIQFVILTIVGIIINAINIKTKRR